MSGSIFVAGVSITDEELDELLGHDPLPVLLLAYHHLTAGACPVPCGCVREIRRVLLANGEDPDQWKAKA